MHPVSAQPPAGIPHRIPVLPTQLAKPASSRRCSFCMMGGDGRGHPSHIVEGASPPASGVWTFVGPGMLRRSKIFIVAGLKHAISSVGAAYDGQHYTHRPI